MAWWTDTDDDGEDDAPSTQFTSGGISGVLVGGTLDTTALFDALDERRTVATSGPRPDKAYALDTEGRLYVMGASLSAADGPFTIVLDDLMPRDSTTGATLERVERIGRGGIVEDGVDGVSYEGTWSPAPGDYTYLRLRYVRDDGSSDRVWISPWFAE